MLAGGAIGAMIVMAIFVVFFISPPESMNQDSIKKNDVEIIEKKDVEIIETPITHNSNFLSLSEIFEKSEPGVVRVNVQRTESIDGVGGVGSGFVFDKYGFI